MKKILHGNDYNPEQWLRYPGILDQDFRLLKLAHLNSVSLGIFSWAALEPEEGSYDFGWMDDIFDRAQKGGIEIILATPSGGKPNWMATHYPEIRRVAKTGVRDLQHARHNHCLTSPVYRSKVSNINALLAKRYGGHPSLIMWHISNEFSGYCYCDLCKTAFRDWLKQKYESLETLNETYWSRFWSHTYTSWDQIDYIDDTVNGLALDWRRFMTDQCRSFIRNEAAPLRERSPHLPVTTNLMSVHGDYNYWELAKELDVISWDSYPAWHSENPELDESKTGMEAGFNHDLFRSMKGGDPFILMETTPSQVNWRSVSPLRRPGVHRLNGLQAVAHGSDGVCYFQFRKSRGSIEQHHGAVVDHVGHENTRVFREVTDLGTCLEKISGVAGARTISKVALLFDWENRWALEGAASPQGGNKDYVATALEHYRPFWARGISVDVIDSTGDLEAYELVVAPMLYALRPEQEKRFTEFVRRGGTLVSTYQTGLVESSGLCIQGGVPGPLRETLGIWVEEFDALPTGFHRQVVTRPRAGHGLSGTYQARHYFDLIHCETAEVLATYGDDFYAGRPALTLNRLGKGRAYYIASRNDESFLDNFFGYLAQDLHLERSLKGDLPKGVVAQCRQIQDRKYVFLLNFLNQPAEVPLHLDSYSDAETGAPISGTISLPAFGSRVLLLQNQ